MCHIEDKTEDFVNAHLLGQTRVMQRIEYAVLGSDYGGVSYTTRPQADEIVRRLAIGPGSRLLDLGAGAGWPALYLAHHTGCDVTMVDPVAEGLRIGSRRSEREGLGARCSAAVAGGAGLPFRAAAFRAISHSDVLC